MKYDADYIISFKLNETFDVDKINGLCDRNPNSKILVEVQNTKGISSAMIRQLRNNVAIRIAGGYDKERVERRKNAIYANGETGNYYVEAVTYTKNETIKILEQMESLESGIKNNWSDIQKLIYVYEKLKRGIMYDPKYEHKFSNEIRSLRGLITRQTVCAGYAIILKEIMDRNGIDCEYVEGFTHYDINGQKAGGHAWNIINIDGKKYPIDLTWDNTTFRSGHSRSFDWLGKDISEFSKSHIPEPEEKTQDYMNTLSTIDPYIINKMRANMGLHREEYYEFTTYPGSRRDGSKFVVSQIGDAYDKETGTNYYRYYYVEINPDGSKQLPLILYSEFNLQGYMKYRLYDRPKYDPENETKEAYDRRLAFYEQNVREIGDIASSILFSKENIQDSLDKNTYYIGNIEKKTGTTKKLIDDVYDIQKPVEKRNLFTYPTRRYRRSDGSVFIAQKSGVKPQVINGTEVALFDIFEVVNVNGKNVLKRNMVFTERNFLKDNRQGMVDDYLSRARLDRKFGEAGGYIGYYDVNNRRTYNPDLVKYFETSKRYGMDGRLIESKPKEKPKLQIPTFSELRDLSLKYRIDMDMNDPFDESKITIKDRNTGEVVTDKDLAAKAYFANFWLGAAGIKYMDDDIRPGEKYAFNSSSEQLYNEICTEMQMSCRDKGVIDTIEIFKNVAEKSEYKWSNEVIVNLFRTPYQTKIINKMFLQSVGIDKQTTIPETLYSTGYVSSLINDEGRGR